MSNELPPICWIVGAEDLGYDAIDQAEDYCPDCARKNVEILRKKYPQFGTEIIVDGGYEDCRDSDNLAYCTECECPLSCYLTTAWISPDWTNDDRMICTYDDWCKADARMG